MLKPEVTIGVTVDEQFLTVSWIYGPLEPGTDPPSETGTWVLAVHDQEVPLAGAPPWPRPADSAVEWPELLEPFVRDALRDLRY